MNVLLTGAPRSGKTTLLNSVLEEIENKVGFVTNELREQGERVGFEAVTSAGDRAVIAHIDLQSKAKVGKYGVDVAALDSLLPPLHKFHENDLLYIDEIAQMELFSPKFKELVSIYLDASNNFLGTIANNFDSSFRQEVVGRKDVSVIEVIPENRDELKEEILKRIKK